MKARLLPLLFLVLALSGCTSIHRLDSTRHEVLQVPQDVKDPGRFESIRDQINQRQPVIFKVAQGERMPVKLTMNLPMGTLEKSEYYFNFNRDTWFLVSHRGCRLSPDGQRWADITNPRALGKLFGFEHGVFSFGFSSSTNQPPYINLDMSFK